MFVGKADTAAAPVDALAAALVSAFATQSRGPVVVFAAANAVMFAVWLIRKYRNKRFGLSRLLVPLLLLLPLAGAALSAYGPQLAQWIGAAGLWCFSTSISSLAMTITSGGWSCRRRRWKSLRHRPFSGPGWGV
ncbi:hypothetical protein HMSSN036_13420 [Paenibacillus macerans]|nr:hypothetical protein HMSSN036_13420 [Paenibacillus macerans]